MDKDEDISEILHSFVQLSLSKETDHFKGTGIEPSSQSSARADPSLTASSITPSPPGTRNEEDLNLNLDASEWRTNKSTSRDTGGIVVYEEFAFHTPCPEEPFIGIMKYSDCDLDTTFSTEINGVTAPERLGCFSCHINPDGKSQSYRPDKSAARYLAYNFKRKPELDLLEGFSEHQNWGRVPPSEMHFLRWVYDNGYDLTDEDGHSDVDFVCYSRILRSIMNAPYNEKDDWICIVTKVRGMIILDEVDTPKRQAFRENQNSNQKRSSYAGYKFEEKITRRYDGELRPTYAEGNRDSFYITSKMKMKNHSILYATRVDCATNKSELPENVEEMKLAQIKTRSAHFSCFRNSPWKIRECNWWIESWLCTLDEIICGQKDESFQIKKISRIAVRTLLNERNGWSPQTCVSFLDLFLAFVKRMVTLELTPYRFYCVPGKAIVCQKLNDPPEKYLPSWFINDELPTD